MDRIFDILITGELFWDCTAPIRVLAGSPWHFARHALFLNLIPYFVSAVGNDDNGKSALRQLDRLGLDYDCGPSGGRTGLLQQVITTDASGIPSYEFSPQAAWDYISAPIPPDVLSTAEAIYFDTLAQRCPCSRETIRSLVTRFAGKYRLLDLQLHAPYDSADIILWSVEHCDILKYTADEKVRLTQALFGKRIDNPHVIAEACFESFGVSIIVETIGTRGARAWQRDGDSCYAEAPGTAPDAPDTDAAFYAAFYNAISHGLPLSGALDTAIRYASESYYSSLNPLYD